MTGAGWAQSAENLAAGPSLPVQQARPATDVDAAYSVQAQALAAPRAEAREAAYAALAAAQAAAAALPAPVEQQPAATMRPSPAPAVVSPGVRRPRRAVLIQIMCWQLGLIAGVVALRQPWPLAIAMITVAAAFIAVTAIPVRGRRAYQWLVLWLGFVRRDRDRDLTDQAGAALLRFLAPEAVTVPGELFMVSRAAGATAVLQPTGEPGAIPSATDLLPGAGEAVAFAVQVVRHAGTDRSRPPRTWIALEARRTVDVHRDPDVHRVLSNAVRRVLRRLRQEGLPARVLVEHEVLSTLAALAHVNAGRGQIRETWRHWRSGPITQITFRIGDATALVDQLPVLAPGVAVTLAVTAHRRPGRAEAVTEAVVRLAALDHGAVEKAAVEFERIAGERGVEVERLDGRHGKGVAATLPIGGPDR
ncbi:type VII secretion protein EccE [Hamadaea sp. NPDC051192]|uniref:type VII secretion protein EccE n=1 Tax=Hamadaea sp. NPDC051192 TaxID=3154940 RepID=UPI00344234A7